MNSRTLYQLAIKNFIMKLGLIVIFLLTAVLVPVTVHDVSAKCMDVKACTVGPIFYSLKTQIQHPYSSLPNIMCPNQDHVLTERPNGKLACITERMAESTGWHIHYKNKVDVKGLFPVAQFESAIYNVPFEITGATFDDLTFQDEMLTAHVTPNAEHGLLSLTLDSQLLHAKMEYCDPRNETDHPDAPFVVVADGIEYGHQMEENSRETPALNISLDENSSIIDIIRTCYG